MNINSSTSSGIPIAISGIGYVYDEYDIEIGRFLVNPMLRMNVPQYFFLHTHGNIDMWASADCLEDCKPEPDMLECFTNKIKIVMDVVSAVDVAWVIGGFGFHKEIKEGSKIGELTFWYSKCEKGIYRIESQ